MDSEDESRTLSPVISQPDALARLRGHSEVFHPLIAAKPILEGHSGGWLCKTQKPKLDGSEDDPEVASWSPTEVTLEQFMVLNELRNGAEIDVDLIDFLKTKGIEMSEFVKSLQQTGHVALEQNKLRLTTQEVLPMTLPMGITSKGKTVREG